MVEKEWKYFISETEASKMKENAERIGIIQWYLSTEPENGVPTEKRIRVEIRKQKSGFLTRWIETRKVESGNISERDETESFIEPTFEILQVLKSKPFVAKIRYVLMEDPEIVIDEFLKPCGVEYNIDVPNYILEIEQKTLPVNFDDLRLYGIETAQKMSEEELKKFKNKNIASFANKTVEINRIIEYVQNRLLGDVIVVMPCATSIFNKNGIRNANTQEQVVNYLDKIVDIFNSKQRSDSKELPGELDSLKCIIDKGFKVSEVYFITNKPFAKEDEDNKQLNCIIKELSTNYFSYDEQEPLQYILLSYILKKSSIETESFKISHDPSDPKSRYEIFREIWQTMDKILAESKRRNKELVIDLTPGLKSIGFLLFLWSLFNQKDVYYKYEKLENELLRIPAIGIDWDTYYIDQIISMFSALQSQDGSVNLSDYMKLYYDFAKLYNFESDEKAIPFYNLSSIQQTFKKKREMPFDYGGKLLKVIDSEKLSEYLETGIIKKWSYMWLGDQIPETVEHSQRHSKRLMDFTVSLLNTLGEDFFLKPFTKEELNQTYVKGVTYKDLLYFILILSMNIHDLGHTYPKFTTSNGKTVYIDSLPSAVRDLHNELTVQLIDDRYFDILGFNSPFEDKIQSFKNIFLEKSLEVLRAVKLVCKYHRNHLKIEKDEVNEKDRKKDFIKTFELDVRTLDEIMNDSHGDLYIEDNTLRRIVKFCARWLKFIDSVDVQADRIVTDAYHKSRILRTKNESLYLIEKLNSCDITNTNQDIQSMLEILLKDVKNILTTKIGSTEVWIEKAVGQELEEIAKKVEKVIYKILEDKINSSEDKDIKLSEELEIMDKIAFKIRQFLHFNKHKSVSAVYPRFFGYNFQSQEGELYIDIIPNESPDITYETLEEIRKEIEDEFEKAQIVKEYKQKGMEKFHLKVCIAEREKKY